MRPHRGVLILVFGILGLSLCQFLGVASWVMANTDLNEMAQGRMDSSGKDLTSVGRILGMVATGVLVFQVLILIVIVFAQLLMK